MIIGQTHKTYSIIAPLASHWRKATCVEVECEQRLNGWRVRVEGLDAEMLHAAKNAGRRWVAEHVAENETYLVFPAGQPCFRASQHRIRIDRTEIFAVRDRGVRNLNSDDWVDDFANHQDRIKTELERG